MEKDHEDEWRNAEAAHYDKLTELINEWKELVNTQKEMQNEKATQVQKREAANNKLKEARVQKKLVKNQLEEKKQQINLLTSERQINIDKLTKREKDLYKYKFKIKDLQKSKHVLTHRTTEMKASLQPKEAQIETQKEKLLELEDEFEKQMNEMDVLGKNLAKHWAKIQQLQSQQKL